MADTQEHAQLLKSKDHRRSFATEELSDEEVEVISSQRMNRRHDHLNALLDRE
jgi:hypothetical protein